MVLSLASVAAPFGASQAGGRRGVSVKTLKRMLKKAGLKTSGRKGALTRRAKKAHLQMGGAECAEGQVSSPEAPCGPEAAGGRRRPRGTRNSRSSRKY